MLRLPDQRWITLHDIDTENDGRITQILLAEPDDSHAADLINTLVGRPGFRTTETSIRRYREHPVP